MIFGKIGKVEKIFKKKQSLHDLENICLPLLSRKDSKEKSMLMCHK